MNVRSCGTPDLPWKQWKVFSWPRLCKNQKFGFWMLSGIIHMLSRSRLSLCL
jgi:hypothetical protein